MNISEFKKVNARGGNLPYQIYDGDKPENVAKRYGGTVIEHGSERFIKIHDVIVTDKGLEYLLNHDDKDYFEIFEPHYEEGKKNERTTSQPSTLQDRSDIITQQNPVIKATSLDDSLDHFQVMEPGAWENILSESPLSEWWAVSDNTGIIAYFGNEKDACAFRLMKINMMLNG